MTWIFLVNKKSKNSCAGGITEQQTRKVTETQKTFFFNQAKVFNQIVGMISE